MGARPSAPVPMEGVASMEGPRTLGMVAPHSAPRARGMPAPKEGKGEGEGEGEGENCRRYGRGSCDSRRLGEGGGTDGGGHRA